MPYVYMISRYDEHGSKDVRATLVRADLPSVLQRSMAAVWGVAPYWVKTDRDRRNFEELCGAATAEASAGLTALLAQTDEQLAAEQKHDLNSGWGGYQLHVVQLEESA